MFPLKQRSLRPPTFTELYNLWKTFQGHRPLLFIVKAQLSYYCLYSGVEHTLCAFLWASCLNIHWMLCQERCGLQLDVGVHSTAVF